MGKFLILAIQHYVASYQGVPKSCWVNILLNLLNAISVGVCFFLSLYFVDLLHFDMLMVGFLMSSYGIGTVVGGFVSGWLCDKMHSGTMAIMSLIAQSIAFFTLAWFHTFHSLLGILLILGISNYSFKTANHVSMLSHCGEAKHTSLKAINISHAASNFGLGLSGVIVGILAAYGYAKIFYAASALLIFSALCLTCHSHQPSRHRKTQHEVPHHAAATFPEINVLILALLSVFSVGLIIAQLGSTYPVYVKNAFPHLATTAVSILFILDTVLIVMFQAPLSQYYGRFNTVLVMGVGAFLMGLGMLVLSLSTTFMGAMMSCCIWTTGEMLFLPTAQLLCYEHGSQIKKGQSIGIFQSTYAISTVVGPAVGGLIYSQVDIHAMWYLSMLIGLACLLSCISLVMRMKKSMPGYHAT